MSAWFLLLALAQGSAPVELDATTRARILQHSPLPAPQADPTNRVAEDPDAMRLGWALFYDPRLSKDGSIACSTCHDPKQAFADGRAVSKGLGEGDRNAPSLYNVAQQRWFFWDGRADSAWAQALQPLRRGDEMGATPEHVLGVLASDEILRANYERVFGPLQRDTEEQRRLGLANVGKSIAAFERKLVSADSAFDRFVRALRAGDTATEQTYPLAARRGLALFVGRANCRLCHAGALFSDGEFHDVGVPSRTDATRPDPMRHAGLKAVLADPFRASGPFSDDPRGARALELDQLVVSSESYGQVRTPSLRNVARTAPYMHAGQFATLPDVLRFYSDRAGALAARHHGESIVKPLNLSDGEIADLLAFLETLTDESLPDVYQRAPARALLGR